MFDKPAVKMLVVPLPAGEFITEKPFQRDLC